MDALRRAEAEKKQGQARPTDVTEGDAAGPAPERPPIGGGSATTEFGPLGSEDVTIQVEHAALEERSAAEKAPAVLGPAGDDRQLADEVGLTLEPMEEDDSGGEAGGGGAAPGASSASPRTSEQTSTMPSARGVRSELDSYFDHSQSLEARPATARRRPGDATLEDIAAHTVVGAQTVFDAAERPKSRRVLVAAAVFAVVAVIGIGLLALLYSQQVQRPRELPSPSVAAGVERPVARELPVVPVDPPRTPGDAEIVRLDTTRTVPPATVATASADTPAEAALVAPPDAVNAATDTAPRSAPAPRTVDTPPAVVAVADEQRAPPHSPTPAHADAPATMAAVPAPMPPAHGVNVGEVRISRSVQPPQRDAALQRAYEAFTSGDEATAESIYREVMSGSAERRDALLGLGAIALRRGNLEHAYQHYARVLQRHPDDAVASAALLSITGGAGRSAQAANLRILLDQYPDAPYIYFALGNWYAQQNRWPDAQLAYFDAVTRDAHNSDYAYNLAVSLDRLGQAAAAVKYYQQSLALAGASSGTFDADSVLDRIGALTADGPH